MMAFMEAWSDCLSPFDRTIDRSRRSVSSSATFKSSAPPLGLWIILGLTSWALIALAVWMIMKAWSGA